MFHLSFFSSTAIAGAPCPYCGRPTLCPSPRDIGRMVELTEQEQIVLETIWDCAGHPELNGALNHAQLHDALYQDDPDGGPEHSTMYPEGRAAVASLAQKVTSMGLGIRYQNRQFCLILLPAQPGVSAHIASKGKGAGFQRQFRPIPCPCCSQQIARPTLEQVMHQRKLQPRERQFLRGIANAPGGIATMAWIYDALFADDCQPKTEKQKYSALKVSISYARAKLRDSGVAVVSLGRGVGYVIAEEVAL